MNAIEEWKKDFKEYINSLSLPRDDYKGIMEYIDEVPTVETDIEVVAKDAYKQGYTDGWKERFGEPNERPQGEWLDQDFDDLKISDYRCNQCGHYQDDITNFCPNCGAKMKQG